MDILPQIIANSIIASSMVVTVHEMPELAVRQAAWYHQY